MHYNYDRLITTFKRLINIDNNQFIKDIILKFDDINNDLKNNVNLKDIELKIEQLFFEENIKYFNEEIIFKSNIFFKNNYTKILETIFKDYNKEIDKFTDKNNKNYIGNFKIINELVITIVVNVILMYNRKLIENTKYSFEGIPVNSFIKFITNSLINNYVSIMFSEIKGIYSDIDFCDYKNDLIQKIELKNFYILINIVLLTFNKLDLADIELKKKLDDRTSRIKSVKSFKLRSSAVNPNSNLYTSFFMNLPMVVAPNKWSISGKCGGYLRNKLGLNAFYLSLRKTNNNIVIKNKSYLDVINSIQDVSFKINVDVIEYTLNNIYRLIKSGIVPDFTYLILTSKEMFLNSDNYNDLNYFECNVYYPNYSKSYKFYINLLLAICLIDFTSLYYPLKIDFRGRMYSQSDYLNPQGCDYEKGFLSFEKGYDLKPKYGLEEWIYSGMSLFKTYSNMFSVLEDFEEVHKKKIVNCINKNYETRNKNFFQFLAFSFEVDSFYLNNIMDNDLSVYSDALLSLDCSQSSNQISSALTLNYDVLEYTNIINTSKSKLDLYEYVSKEILKKLYNNRDIKINKELYDELILNKDIIDSRSFFKKVVMAAVNYGLTPYSFRQEIRQTYTVFSKSFINIIVKETFDFLYKDDGIFYKQYSFFKFLKEVIKRRKFEYSINFEEVKGINTCINNELIRINKYNPIKINMFNNLCLYIYYIQGKNITFKPYINGKRHTFTIRHQLNEDITLLQDSQEDKRKILQGFVANFIHSLDAEICIRCLEYFRDRHIPIRSNHDCFYISPKYHEELRSVFRSVFYDMFKNPKSLIIKLLDGNNIILTDSEKEYIDNFFDKGNIKLDLMYYSKWFLN